MIEDVSDERGFPFGMLDPSAPVRFEIDGVECASLDGFVESLKFERIIDQKNVTKRVGEDAREQGKNQDNPANQIADRILHWQGRTFKRNSKEFDKLLARVFREMAKNARYQEALLITQDVDFRHPKGKIAKKDTILTRKELTDNLKKLRADLRQEFKQGF